MQRGTYQPTHRMIPDDDTCRLESEGLDRRSGAHGGQGR